MPTTPSLERIRILSLDGGGVRGLSSLLILRELMDQLQELRRAAEPLRPCDEFDLIVGTGTGGISALLLGRLHLSADEAIEEYIRLTSAIFTSSPHLPLDGDVLESYFRTVVQRYLGDPDALLFNPANPPRCRVAVLAAASANVDAPPYIFKTYSAVQSFKLVDVARATSATAGIFPPVSLGRPPIEFLDAGSFGYNNPTQVALLEAREICPSGYVELAVSLGTGKQKIVDADRWGELEQTSQCLAESCEPVHNYISRMPGPLAYFRFSVDRGLDTIGMDEWTEDGCRKLAGVTSGYLQNTEPNRGLRDCVQAICSLNRSPLDGVCYFACLGVFFTAELTNRAFETHWCTY